MPTKDCPHCFDSRLLVCGILCVRVGKKGRQNTETRYRNGKQLLVFGELITEGVRGVTRTVKLLTVNRPRLAELQIDLHLSLHTIHISNVAATACNLAAELLRRTYPTIRRQILKKTTLIHVNNQQKLQTGCGLHRVSDSVGTGVQSSDQSGRGLKLTTHLHLAPRLRINGAKVK